MSIPKIADDLSERTTVITINENDNTITKKVSYDEGIVEMSIYNILHHPNILKPISAVAKLESKNTGGFEQYVYITTPRMKTISADDIPTKDIHKWFTDMLSALCYLNHLGISQNDIKLDNMLYDPDTNNYLLFDFGFATIGSKCLQNRVGTPTTVAPETVYRNLYLPSISSSGEYREKREQYIITAEADVYSLGIVLFQVVTGLPSPVYRGGEIYTKKMLQKTC
jgi:serine/threonine protein kinase